MNSDVISILGDLTCEFRGKTRTVQLIHINNLDFRILLKKGILDDSESNNESLEKEDDVHRLEVYLDQINFRKYFHVIESTNTAAECLEKLMKDSFTLSKDEKEELQKAINES